MIPRTKRQRQILNFIQEFVTNHGYEPSYQQIANHLGVKSKGGIAKHLESLEKKGLISRTYNNGVFNLELIPQKTVSDLVCEIEWMPNSIKFKKNFQNEYLYVPRFLLGYLSPGDVRAMIVEDNGMLDKHLCEFDVALIELKTFARDGEIIAALVENKMLMIRKFYRAGSQIELAASNDNYDSIIISADKVEIIGIYKGVLRPMM